ncbi:MAG: DUF3386 family protein [Chloroflexi bacterium]|nr:DUF3386 family protein [Chloroflexota bacterium]
MAAVHTTDRPAGPAGQVADSAAHDLLRRAYEATYRFPVGFAGLRAALEFTRAAAETPEDAEVVLTTRGCVQVRSPRAVSVEIDTDAAGRDWLWQEIASLVGHRWPIPYGEADGRHALRLGPDDGHPLGRLVEVHDRFRSRYRVRDGQIVQITREMGKIRFSIHIQERFATADGRTLPTHFSVSYWEIGGGEGAAEAQPKQAHMGGRLTRADTYSDTYVRVAGHYLPASRRVITADDGALTIHELRLSEHTVDVGGPAAAQNGSATAARLGTEAGAGRSSTERERD